MVFVQSSETSSNLEAREMMNNTMRVCVALGAAVLVGGAARADVTFSDTEFPNSGWGLDVFTVGAGGTSSGIQVSGANPGFGRQVTNSITIGGEVYGLHRYGTSLATRYEPSVTGAITSVDFSIDSRFISGLGGLGHGISLGAKQGSVLYRAGFDTTGSTGLWETHSSTGNTAASFTPLGGGPAIDFSSTAAPIRFGFVVSNGAVNETYSNVVLYDNFQVVIHNVPAPAGAAVLGLGGLMACRRRRVR
jgi:hypothetical protein